VTSTFLFLMSVISAGKIRKIAALTLCFSQNS
jgi:hypothetical protein